MLAALALNACLYPETNPGETKTRIHANRDIRDTLVEGHAPLYDTTLYAYGGNPEIYGFHTVPGNMDLFEYYRKYPDKIAIADDEYSEGLYFLVPPGVEKLVIDSTVFALYKPRYRPFGQVLSYGVVDSGKIVVTRKSGGLYDIEVDVGMEMRYMPGFFNDSNHTSRWRLAFRRTFLKAGA
jgi:hypothetical protein